MTYDEFRIELKGAKLSLREFAALLKLNPNSLSNCKAIGTVPDHIALIAALIHELVRCGIEYRHAIKRVRVKPKAPRGRGIVSKQR